MEKYEQVKKSIQERYKLLETTPADYVAKTGDVVVVNMNGYEVDADGKKLVNKPLPAIAQGDSVEIALETGKFMEGFIDGLVGKKAGKHYCTVHLII
jgi:FKBP-type peptidyl-prolyl cis-trans isomerase (trigger factor)